MTKGVGGPQNLKCFLSALLQKTFTGPCYTLFIRCCHVQGHLEIVVAGYTLC